MITPSFNLTATERVLPKLALDFTTATLDPRITFTRALNTATVTDQNGAVVLVNADTPRFDYANGVCKGLLIEETRTNLLVNSVWNGAISGTPGTAPTNWIASYTGGSIVSVAAGKYASGNAIRMSASSNRQVIFQSYSVSANTTYTASVSLYVNSNGIRIDNYLLPAGLPTGATLTYKLNGVDVAASSIVPVGVWSTIQAIIVISSTAGSIAIRVGIGCGSNQTSDATFDMPQLEAGAFPTSYIPTTSAALTRNADVATMTGTNFSDWYNQTAGTFVVEGFFAPSFAAFPPTWGAVSDGTTQNRIMGYSHVGGVYTNVRRLNVNQGDPAALGTVTVNSAYKMASSYAANNVITALNGSIGSALTTVTIPTVNQLQIGANGGGSGFANAYIKRLFYYPLRLTNNEVRSFSK